MTRFTTTLLVAVAVALVAAAAGGAFAHSSRTVHVTIRHQLHGCHAWSVDGSAYKPSQRIVVTRGTTIEATNNDVMPHRLIELAGPRVSVAHALMNHVGASAKVVLAKPGTYSFRTKAGEDYMPGMKTVGEDNVLRLTVVVK